ncbi:MAG: hypothetical protein ORN98_05340 [Alphaproteobacteria bacterium]|nr:hypothetical protein [Alphaproteobacteria bacterium]
MKTKFIAPAILLGVSVMLTGCASTETRTHIPDTGFMINVPVSDIDPFNLGSKKGESCPSDVGGGGLIAAAKKGNIHKIKYVETVTKSTVEIMGGKSFQYCTVVYGD